MSDPQPKQSGMQRSGSVSSLAGAIAEAVCEGLNRTLSPAQQESIRRAMRSDQPDAGESQTPVVPLFQRVASISSRFTRSTGRTEASPLQSGPSSSSGLAASGTRRRSVYPTLFGSEVWFKTFPNGPSAESCHLH